MNFTERLNESLQKIKTTTKKTSIKVAPVIEQSKTTNVNLQRIKLSLSDGLLREMNELEQGGSIPDLAPEQGMGSPEAGPDLGSENPESMGGGDIGGGEEIAPTSSGNNYTLVQAKDQLDGIIKQWMDMSGNYPEGEERHKFIEIGERLREISGVLQRDFIGK